MIRIIRNADIDMDEAFYDEEMDYRDTMEQLIKERRKLCPVKLEYSRVLDDKVISDKKLPKDDKVYVRNLSLIRSRYFILSHLLRCHLYQRYRMT